MPETKGFLIQIYDVTPILSGNDSAGDLDGIFLSISQTGADYWGSYPVLIKYDKDQGFSLADFDSGNSSADSQIKPYMGPPSGIVEIANQLNENNKARSIMAEGADFNYPNIEVTFYTDNNPHSFQHTTVTLKFPVSGLPPSY
jgi:hypothetical protein